MQAKEKYLRELKILEENQKAERKWMDNDKYKDAKYQSFFEDVHNKEKSDLDKKYFTKYSNMSLQEMKLM